MLNEENDKEDEFVILAIGYPLVIYMGAVVS